MTSCELRLTDISSLRREQKLQNPQPMEECEEQMFMLRLVMIASMALVATACMTETDKQVWKEFKEVVKSDEAKTAPEASEAADPKVEAARKSEEAAFSDKLNTH